MRVLLGILSTVLVVGNVTINCVALFLLGLVRVSMRMAGLAATERRVARWMDHVIDSWVVLNRALFSALGLTRIETHWAHAQGLSRERWYMVVSNHQSWTDILVLQIALFARVPPLKFFTKRQLLWVPLLGQAMWLLDFPYVRRMSRDQIAANPELLAIDRRATEAACEKFRNHPTSVLNFLEGTRCTPEKYAAQPDPRFRHLLNPKTGGLAQVLAALNDRLHKLIDVTIAYPDGVPSFWEFMQGRCPRVTLHIDCLDVPAAIAGATDESERRAATGAWAESLWEAKDRRLAADGRFAGHRSVVEAD